MLDRFHVDDVDYDNFRKRGRSEGESKMSRGPDNVQNIMIPSLRQAADTSKPSRNLGVARILLEKMSEDNVVFPEQDVHRKEHTKPRNITVSRSKHEVVDFLKVERKTAKAQDSVEGELKVLKKATSNFRDSL